MKFFIPAFIAGLIINAFILPPDYGIEIRALWTGSIKSIDTIEPSRNKAAVSEMFSIWSQEGITAIDGNGKFKGSQTTDGYLTAMSGNGQFFVRFEKVGSTIELLNWKGDRFWNLKSHEYPYLSYNGKLILLLIADNSSVRIIDYNGSEIGKKVISGRFCTGLAFSTPGDNGAVGFLDGTYYFINSKGALLYGGRVPIGSVVKGVAVSPGGLYGAVHYGNKEKDHLEIVGIADKRVSTMQLGTVHLAKTGINVTDKGCVTVIDGNAIINADDDGDEVFRIPIKAARIGYSAIIHENGFYAATYSAKSGDGIFYLFNEIGEVLMTKEYPAETFLHPMMKSGLILLRGSDNLYCYNIHSRPAE